MQAYQLDPADTLFFRDARPMQAGAGSGGHGARWPLPNILHEGLRANLLSAAGIPRGAKTIKVKRQSGDREKTIGSYAFQSLRTIGPFPMLDDKALYLPRPLDIVPMKAPDGGAPQVTNLVPELHEGVANWPGEATWLRGLANPTQPSKAELPQWVSLDWLCRYLATPGPWPLPSNHDRRLYEAEPRIGIEIEREKGSVKEGQLYASEHLRLCSGVSLWFRAALGDREIEDRPGAVSVDTLLGTSITLGGESRIARLRASGMSDVPKDIEKPPTFSGTRIKWVLASPAVFTGGWRPGWIDGATGQVMLGAENPERQPGETRRQWRARMESGAPLAARLVAVCCGRPTHFSGWDQDAKSGKGAPKPTMLAVPSGSVYYFEADNDDVAQALVHALHGRVRSDYFGEKGMGYGFCGTWQEEKPFHV